MCYGVTHRVFVVPNAHLLSYPFLAPECETTIPQPSFQDEWVGNFVLMLFYKMQFPSGIKETRNTRP